MRKIVSILLLIAIFLPVFSGCSKAEDRRTVELTEQNLWKYVEIAMITDFVEAESDESLKCSITGALDQAIYEDVVITFTVTYYEPGATAPDHKKYDVEITLNAGGNAEFEVIYSGIAQILNGKGEKYESAPAELYWYNRRIEVTSVRGNVILAV